MSDESSLKPRLRPLESFRVPVEADEEMSIGLRDPSGLSDVVLTLTPAALYLVALMDGTRGYAQIRGEFRAAHTQDVPRETFDAVVDQLSRAMFLEEPRLEAHFQRLQDEYRQAPVRPMPHAEALGIDPQGRVFAEMLDRNGMEASSARVVGLIAPHLDYPRGAPCYARAYGALKNRPAPNRVVILGTNHYGRSASVVATAQRFETPLGVTRCDVEFLGRLEERCGDLRRYEWDHGREHSVELQVGWLQHLFGADAFNLLAILCPDPCGPTRTAPGDGHGADLRVFAETLGELVRDDPEDTLLVAGADLSHIGANFGDERELNGAFLGEVAARDHAALATLTEGRPEAFLDAHAVDGNPTRVCSVGCIYALATALHPATCTILGYHQAVDQPSQTGVTCVAAVYT